MTNEDTPSSLAEAGEKRKQKIRDDLNQLDSDLETQISNINGNPDMIKGLQTLRKEIEKLREARGVE